MRNKLNKISLIGLLVMVSQGVFAAAPTDTLKLGQIVEGFTLHNTVKGQPETVSLSDYANKKGVVVVFMTNGCYHCILYRDRIKAIQTTYAAKGFSLITINPSDPSYSPEETLEEMQKNSEKGRYDFPYLQDPDQKVTVKYGVRYTPEAFVLWRQGKDWVLKYAGPIDNDMDNKKKDKTSYVQNVLNALVNHQKVPEYSVIK